ncbi:MAG: GDP-mannose 4,6-dehydratase [Bacteroidota bacterium]|nr:GDP-mannose 4,6-dehydratase [Candidatus Kapabacteria bacterium]MDW8220065.1 GDP-mannose 4,6-dehydratase [Bacteroidota bacterium]
MTHTHSSSKIFLITGGAGFIGSHLSEYLLREGHTVFALDNLSTGTLENVSPIQACPEFRGRYHFIRADIMNEMVLDRIISQVDIVIHLAAAVGVQLIVEKPVHTIETNIMGSEIVLKTALRYGCRVLLASTSEVYGKGVKIPFREEDDVLLGNTSKSRWAYAASKMIDEFLGLAYYQEFGLEVVPFRLFNTVGVRQTGRYGMVIPRFVQQALRGEPIRVFGDGMQSRCFCDVRDVVRAIYGLSLHSDAPGKLFNIGNTEEISIMKLAQRIKALSESSSDIILVPYSEAYPPGFEDMQRRMPDISRISTLLGWKPTYSLDEILMNVIDYERAIINTQHSSKAYMYTDSF